ncbi:Flp pilus assembly complex ATPase component TadA [Microcoleus sp. FACHB-53]|nr:Flp pilus assembly complex ATPase component TadA [Microcoleus sp. FACHB-53]
MTNSSSQRRALIVRNEVSPFGKSLIAAGYVDTDQMQNALVESRKSGRPLTEILESMTGRQLSPDLLRQYKKQQLFELKVLYGVESLDPEINEIATHQVGQLIDTLLPIDICRRYRLVPLSKNETQPPSLLVAMVDPDNLDAQDDLNRILRPQGITLQRMVITQEDYQQIISKYLDEKLAKQKQMEVEQAVDVQKDLQNIDSLDTLSDAPDEEAELDVRDAEDAPVISLVNKVLAKALQEGVSDIHVEPQENALRIRFRKDGVLRQAFEPLPKKITPAVSARFKIMAELDIAERRLPQDGKIRRMYQGRKVDFRVSTLPSRYGEKVVLRILDNEQTQLGLDKLITDQDTLETVRDMANRPFGLILVTGPTGSGKSTTLYSMLAERNDPGVNISTAEDPIEYSLAGITQVQVLREKGMDFASILRSFLRQDPDVILVGETRDKETAKTAIEAALTGHLVLTTLHTNDAAGAIPRLDEMGVEPFMVSNALLGVLAQRLIRRVCSECRITYVPTSAELGRFGLSTSRDGEIMLYQANTLQPDEIQEARAKGKLCQLCNGVGYKGRVGVYEVMRISDRLQTLINEAAPAERLKEAAVEEGMTTLLAYSLNLVQQGYTTLDEVERVTFTDSGLEAERKAKRKSSLSCRTCSATLQQEWLDCPYCMTPRFQD